MPSRCHSWPFSEPPRRFATAQTPPASTQASIARRVRGGERDVEAAVAVEHGRPGPVRRGDRGDHEHVHPSAVGRGVVHPAHVHGRRLAGAGGERPRRDRGRVVDRPAPHHRWCHVIGVADPGLPPPSGRPVMPATLPTPSPVTVPSRAAEAASHQDSVSAASRECAASTATTSPAPSAEDSSTVPESTSSGDSGHDVDQFSYAGSAGSARTSRPRGASRSVWSVEQAVAGRSRGTRGRPRLPARRRSAASPVRSAIQTSSRGAVPADALTSSQRPSRDTRTS